MALYYKGYYSTQTEIMKPASHISFWPIPHSKHFPTWQTTNVSKRYKHWEGKLIKAGSLWASLN